MAEPRPSLREALDDIGRSAAAALLEPIPAEGATVELIGDMRSRRECRQLLSAYGRRPRRVPIPTPLFRAMVGDEFIRMWQWITTLDAIPITPGLTDVPTWIGRLDAPGGDAG